MRASRAALVGVLALAAAVGACSAISHVSALQPPSEATSNVAKDLPTKFVAIAAPRVQLGIGVDFYTYPGQNVLADAEETVSFVKSLHANSISISFPYFMHGEQSNTVYATDDTPTPAELAQVAGVAEKAGLYVSLRPLLDEGSLGGPRTNWAPVDPAAWFASYEKFLQPYAQMAQLTDIPEFIDGAELTYFGHSRLWNGVVTSLRAVYAGTLVYDNNFGISISGNGGVGVTEAVDAYQPQNVPVTASQAQLTAGWLSYERTLPPGTVLLEVDIAAVAGAYLRPFQVSGWNASQLLPFMQVRWFTGACDALPAANLGGIYFWATGLGQRDTTPPALSDPASWLDSPGQTAIAACFGRLSGQ
jgi:hypothetical protein